MGMLLLCKRRLWNEGQDKILALPLSDEIAKEYLFSKKIVLTAYFP